MKKIIYFVSMLMMITAVFAGTVDIDMTIGNGKATVDVINSQSTHTFKGDGSFAGKVKTVNEGNTDDVIIDMSSTSGKTKFNFDGAMKYQANSNKNNQYFYANVNSKKATMKLTYDTSDNRGVVRRLSDQVSILSGKDGKTNYEMIIANRNTGNIISSQKLELKSDNVFNFGKTKWGADAIIYGAGYNVNDVTIPTATIEAKGKGKFSHYTYDSTNQILTDITFNNGMSATLSAVAK